MRARRGFALIAALWMLVALTAVGLQVSLAAKVRRLATANTLDDARARLAAEAGVQHARQRLESLLRADGTPLVGSLALDTRGDPWGAAQSLFSDTVSLGEARYHVSVVDAGTRLGLNAAAEEELRRLFFALRVDAGVADRLAQAIEDWRDVDDLKHARGAERAEYVEAGASVLPANRPFVEVGELLDVRGMTPSLYDVLSPYLTVFGTGRVNLSAADRPVLLALPGMTEEAVAAIVRSRGSATGTIGLDALAGRLSSTARAAILSELPRLMTRTVRATEEPEVISEGWAIGGRVRVRVRALLMRAGSSAMMVARRSE